MAAATTEEPPKNAQLSVVNTYLNRAMKEVLVALPGMGLSDEQRKNMGDRYRRILLSMAKTKNMQTVIPESFASSLIRVAQIGLDPEPIMGHIYLVPFKLRTGRGEPEKSELQIIVGYKGYLELARRTGQLKDAWADVVRSGDRINWIEGRERTFEVYPDPMLDVKTSPLLLSYALCNFTNGGYGQKVLRRSEVLERKMRSGAVKAAIYINSTKGPNDNKMQTPWDTDEAAMWSKSAVRAMVPQLPQSAEMQKAIQYDADSTDEERRAADDGTIDLQPDSYTLRLESESEEEEEDDAGTTEPEQKTEPKQDKPKPVNVDPKKPEKSAIMKSKEELANELLRATSGGNLQLMQGLKLDQFDNEQIVRLNYCFRTVGGPDGKTKAWGRAQTERWLSTFEGTVQQACDLAEGLLVDWEAKQQQGGEALPEGS